MEFYPAIPDGPTARYNEWKHNVKLDLQAHPGMWTRAPEPPTEELKGVDDKLYLRDQLVWPMHDDPNYEVKTQDGQQWIRFVVPEVNKQPGLVKTVIHWLCKIDRPLLFLYSLWVILVVLMVLHGVGILG